MPPSLGRALGLGLRGLAREPWLVAVGTLVAAARRAARLPAWLVLGLLLARATVVAFARAPLDPGAPLAGIRAALGAPRFVGLVVGLWLAGALLGAALRVAWLAGALPTLGGAMAGGPRVPRFAPSVAYGFPRVLAAAALGLVLDLSADLFAWALALAALVVTVHATAAGGSVALAAAVALALTIAVAVPLALGAVADAAVARAAIRADGPGEAFAEGARRFLARPGTFLLAALAFAVLAVVVPGIVEAAGGTATGFARGADPIVLIGPNLMVGALSLLVAAAVDLWWLGTVAALACGGEEAA